MPLRIVHTADNHIGMSFASRGYRPEVREALVQERFDALERTVALANTRKAHFLVIAGDLFDRVGMAKGDIKKTAAILHGLEESRLVLLPGNHDYYEPAKDSLWDIFRREFKDSAQLLLLDDCQPVEVDTDAGKVIFYPAPCRSKHSANNLISWVKDVEKDKVHYHIGIAHGSVEGFSADFTQQYFPMTHQELKSAGVDFWLMGHTHIRYPEQPQKQNPLFFFPATPTPDGFDRRHEGYVWYLEVDEKKKLKMESVRTGRYRFFEMEKAVQSVEDIASLKKELSQLDEPQYALVKLRLEGSLAEEDLNELDKAIADVKAQLAYLEPDNEVRLHITPEHIDKYYMANSLPHRLLSRLSAHEADHLALQLANELIQKLKA